AGNAAPLALDDLEDSLRVGFRAFHLGTWNSRCNAETHRHGPPFRGAMSGRLRPRESRPRSRCARADNFPIMGALFGNTNGVSGRLAALLGVAAIGGALT